MKSLELDEGKVWVHEDDEVLVLGLTGPGVDEIGYITHIDLPTEGQSFDAEEVLITIVGTQGEMDVILPASGVVTHINEDLMAGDFEIVTDDPLDSGWLVRFEFDSKEEFQRLVG